MPFIKQQPKWEVIYMTFNMSFSNLYKTDRVFKTERAAIEFANSIKSPQEILSIREIREYIKVPQREVW